MPESQKTSRRKIVAAANSGAFAGLAVDVLLFPIDSIKTRLQVKSRNATLFPKRNLYSGIVATLLGSMPSSFLFFSLWVGLKDGANINVFCASAIAEAVSCAVRVPAEVVKQQMQAGFHKNFAEALTKIRRSRKGLLGFYSGYWQCLARDIPFSLVQYPLFCFFKDLRWNNDEPFPAALCGFMSGAVAGAITAPLDFIKTTAMTSLDCFSTQKYQKNFGVFATLKHLYQANGARIFLAGIYPRIVWLGVGGAIYLGTFDALYQCM